MLKPGKRTNVSNYFQQKTIDCKNKCITYFIFIYINDKILRKNMKILKLLNKYKIKYFFKNKIWLINKLNDYKKSDAIFK